MLRPDREVDFTHVYPPIPIREFDWMATWDGDEPDDNGRMLHGYGRTPLEALVELLDHTETHEELAEMHRARKAQ